MVTMMILVVRALQVRRIVNLPLKFICAGCVGMQNFKIHYNGAGMQPVVAEIKFADGQTRTFTVERPKRQGIEIRLPLKNLFARYKHYQHYMYWVIYCKECKAQGLNPYSMKNKHLTVKNKIASFAKAILAMAGD